MNYVHLFKLLHKEVQTQCGTRVTINQKRKHMYLHYSMPSIVLCSLWGGSCSIDFTQLGQQKCFGTK